ncbi:hypothetical protein MD484_g8647, partial [Candolleomyces efflorescens]
MSRATPLTQTNSGCITSAESVLITLQSHTEVLTFLESNEKGCEDLKKMPVLSIAPQSLASLAAALTTAASSSSSSSTAPRITPRQVLRRVQAFCKDALGIDEALDITFARHLALQEHVLEFEERKAKDALGGADAQGQLPMLASACPGWICYAEKAHSEMLPFISKTKSPQQVMGTLVKEWLGKQRGKSPDKVYHVSVMPCYDKKLEASRKDFYNDIYSTRDVDCVITTGELETMMREKGWDLSQPVPGELHDPSSFSDDGSWFPELLQHPGSSSGSYLMSIIEHLQQTSTVPLTLASKVMRNADYEEFTLTEESSGKIVFKGAKCYGFRNLQNVVRKVGKERGVRVGVGAAGRMGGGRVVTGGAASRRLKKAGGDSDAGKERQYDYVEVMACPSGPPSKGSGNDEEGYSRDWEQNGVAIDNSRPVDVEQSGVVMNAKWGDKDWTRKVEEAYWLDGGREVKKNQSAEDETCSKTRINGVVPHDLPPQSAQAASPLVDISTRQLITTPAVSLDLGGIGGGREDKGSTKGGEGWPVSPVNVYTKMVNGGSPGSTEQKSGQWNVRPLIWAADKLAARVLNDLCGQDGESAKRRDRFFRTEYHAVENNEVVGLAVKW